jgi:hypothetical protein
VTADVDQDPLPGMPKRPARRPASRSVKPTWKRISQPRTKAAIMCSECSLQAAERTVPVDKVRRAVWRRTVGDLVAHLCHPHALPLRMSDGVHKVEERKEKRAWRRKK